MTELLPQIYKQLISPQSVSLKGIRRKKSVMLRGILRKYLVDRSGRYPGLFISHPGKGLVSIPPLPSSLSLFRLKQRRDGKIKQVDLCETTEKRQRGTVGTWHRRRGWRQSLLDVLAWG